MNIPIAQQTQNAPSINLMSYLSDPEVISKVTTILMENVPI